VGWDNPDCSTAIYDRLTAEPGKRQVDDAAEERGGGGARHVDGVPMITAGLLFAGIAALLHVYIFRLESLAWTAPRTRAVFGTTPEEAETTKALAVNQGFYNLFLAVVSAVGIVMVLLGHRSVGAALIFAGVGSMLAAALVLLISSPDKARAAVVQGTVPLVAVVLLGVGLL
jgi:putative membrane protein